MSDDRLAGMGNPTPNPPGRSLTDTEMEDLLPGYVFGALEPEEMLAVEAYARTHQEWETRLRGMEMAAASLAHDAARAPLPARLKQRLIERARDNLSPEELREWQQAGAPARRSPRFGAPPAAKRARRQLRGMRAIPPAQPRTVQPSGRSWFGIFWRSVAVAGALAAILLLAGLTWQLRNQAAQLSAQISTLQNQMAQAQAESAELQQVNSALQQQIQSINQEMIVMTEADQRIILAGTEDAPTASGDFYRRGEVAILVLRGLPPLPLEQTYQLWILPPDGALPLPADLLQVDNATAQNILLLIPPEQSDLVGVGVSIEPAQGSQTPTTIVLLGAESPPSA